MITPWACFSGSYWNCVFRLSGGADYCNLIWSSKNTWTICGQKIYSRVVFIYLHSWRFHFSHYRFHHIHGIQDKHLRVDAEGHCHVLKGVATGMVGEVGSTQGMSLLKELWLVLMIYVRTMASAHIITVAWSK